MHPSEWSRLNIVALALSLVGVLGLPEKTLAQEAKSPVAAPSLDSKDSPGLEGTPPEDASFADKIIFHAGGGVGYPLNTIKSPVHYEVGIGMPLGDRLAVGAFFRQSDTDFEDRVHFNSTGYTELRTYRLSTQIIGGFAFLRLTDRVSLTGAVGATRTTSTAKEVLTDAPLPSTLEIGSSREASWYFGYRAGLSYEYPLGRVSLGTDLGYSLSSTHEQSQALEAYATLYLRYYGWRKGLSSSSL